MPSGEDKGAFYGALTYDAGCPAGARNFARPGCRSPLRPPPRTIKEDNISLFFAKNLDIAKKCITFVPDSERDLDGGCSSAG